MMNLKLKWLDTELAANRGIGPGFHFLRHALSLLILAHHCRVAVYGVGILTVGYVKGAAIGQVLASHLPIGLLFVELTRPALFSLVGLFFALSGFLVYGSAVRTKSIRTFFGNRALRLLPALSVEVALSALILGPLVTEFGLKAYFGNPQFLRYFGNIIGEVTFSLPGVFLKNPWPDMVNANLWTLPPELGCYALMLVMLATGITGRKRLLGALVLVAFIALQVTEMAWPGVLPLRDHTTHFTAWFIVFLFVAGAAFFANADLIPIHPVLFVAAGAAYWVLMLTNTFQCTAGILLVYCMAFIGMVRFPWFDRLLKLDLSYGTYLFGFPIIQAMVFLLHPHLRSHGPALEFAILLPLTIVLTTIFSAGSWIFIEKPALSLRKHLIREPAPSKKATLAAENGTVAGPGQDVGKP